MLRDKTNDAPGKLDGTTGRTLYWTVNTLLPVYLVTGQNYRSKKALVERIACEFGWQSPRAVSIHQKFTCQTIEMESLLKTSETIPCFCGYPNITPLANLPRPRYLKTGYATLNRVVQPRRAIENHAPDS